MKWGHKLDLPSSSFPLNAPLLVSSRLPDDSLAAGAAAAGAAAAGAAAAGAAAAECFAASGSLLRGNDRPNDGPFIIFWIHFHLSVFFLFFPSDCFGLFARHHFVF